MGLPCIYIFRGGGEQIFKGGHAANIQVLVGATLFVRGQSATSQPLPHSELATPINPEDR